MPENRNDIGDLLSSLSQVLEEGKDDYIYDSALEVDTFEYPITVSKMDVLQAGIKDCASCQTGQPVMVRPCGDKYEKKTFLGIMLGNAPIGIIVSYRPSTERLNVVPHTNPAIYIPDLKEIVYGCGSWWGMINSEEDLKQISDADIQNVWYVKALKEMQEKKGEPEDA